MDTRKEACMEWSRRGRDLSSGPSPWSCLLQGNKLSCPLAMLVCASALRSPQSAVSSKEEGLTVRKDEATDEAASQLEWRTLAGSGLKTVSNYWWPAATGLL